MQRSLPRTLLAAALPAALLLASLAPPALAKEGGVARFDAPLPAGAESGTVLEVGWTVMVESQGDPSPIVGSPVFIRLVPPGGGLPIEAAGTESPAGTGHYVASITVPKGGIGSIEIGLRGISCNGDETACGRSDWLFAVSDELSGFTAPATVAGSAGGPGSEPSDPAATTAPATSASDQSSTWILVGLALALSGLVAAVAGITIAGRRSANRAARA